MALSSHNTALTRRGDPTYTLTHETIGGAIKHLCNLTCAVCGERASITWNQGRNHEAVGRRWRGLGWRFDTWNPHKCVCPKHNNNNKNKEALMASTSPTSLNGETKEAASLEPPAGAPAPPFSPPPLPRPLTSDEKTAVRRLLDENFDETLGRYISGYSDQKIGDACKVPWAAVAALREVAYGPIKEDARVAPLRQELTAIRAEMEKLDTDTAACLDQLHRRLKSAETKLAEIGLPPWGYTKL